MRGEVCGFDAQSLIFRMPGAPGVEKGCNARNPHPRRTSIAGADPDVASLQLVEFPPAALD